MIVRSLLIGTLTAAFVAGAAQACTRPANAVALGSGMIEWINQQRQAKGLNALTPSDKLAAAAQGHACDMAQRGYFAHQRAGGPDLGGRVKAKGYRYRTAAENIAKTRAADIARPAKVWRDSPPHWANILKPNVADIGIGVASENGQVYWVMNIGRPR